MAPMLIQESVDWEFRGPYHHWNLPWHEPFVQLLILLYLSWLVLTVLKVWWKLGLSSGSVYARLKKLLLRFEKRDLEISSLLAGILPRTPEGHMSVVSSDSDAARAFGLLDRLHLANARFDFELSKIKFSVETLGVFTVVILLAGFWQMSVEIADDFTVVVESKATSVTAIYNSFAHIVGNFAGVLGVVTVGFIVYTYLRVRIERRASYWKSFIAQAEIYLSKGDMGA